MQAPQSSNITQFEAQYTTQEEKRQWKSLTINVANQALQQNLTLKKIEKIIPKLVAQ